MAPLAGLAYAAAEGLGADVLIVDTGGTTFDVSLIRWMLGLSTLERLEAAQDMIDTAWMLREGAAA